MTTLADAKVLLQADRYGGTTTWLDRSGNGHHAVFGDGVTPAKYPVHAGDHFTFDGSQFFNIADHADLNFAAADPLTVMVICELSSDAGTFGIITKRGALNASSAGYSIHYSGGNYPVICDGTVQSYDTMGVLTVNTKYNLSFVRNIVDDDIEGFKDGTGTGSPSSDDTTGSLSNALALTIGALSVGGWLTGKIYAFALWRAALTDAEVASLGTELALPAPPGGRNLAAPGQLLVTGG